MRFHYPAWAALVASLFLTVTSVSTAFADDDPPKATAPAKQTPPKSSEEDARRKMECDMKGKDMSRMSAEEHKKMMEKCKMQHPDGKKEDHAHDGNAH